MELSPISIIKIKYLKNLAEITTADQQVYKNINIEALHKFSIKEGDVEKKYFDEFLLENEKQNAKIFLIRSLSRSPKTEKMARQKLHEKGFRKKAIDYAISFALEYGFINDEKYANEYSSASTSNKGEYRIRFEMMQKGLSEEEIENALKKIDEQEYIDAAERLAIKYMKGKEVNKKNYERLCRYLISRGYSFDLVKKIAEPFFSST